MKKILIAAALLAASHSAFAVDGYTKMYANRAACIDALNFYSWSAAASMGYEQGQKISRAYAKKFGMDTDAADREINYFNEHADEASTIYLLAPNGATPENDLTFRAFIEKCTLSPTDWIPNFDHMVLEGKAFANYADDPQP